ncbi:MAG: branched-chain amino acid aminotransferase [SAR324 cluster bacterium]|nr:branched-chain amino acid aminotransferase [SAR324 cluster bacterium]
MNKSHLEKKDLAWDSLGFDYIRTDYRFTATNKDGQWSEGELITDEYMRIHEGSPALHYSQQCFEGLKAQTTEDGRVLLFRPKLNAERFYMTAQRLMMPPVPEELFMKGVKEVVRANYAWIPPYGSGASLYIRPLLIGVGENMGLRPAKQYDFRVIVSPVGPYYKGGGISLISLAVTEFDRAAPLGTGKFKAGANYAGGLLSTQTAKDMGANEALYLDSAQRKYLDEAGSANTLLAMSNNRFVTPKSKAILPSVTRRSIMTLAKEELKMNIEERPVAIREEMAEIEEMAACGTAAVISPVGKICLDGQWHSFFGGGEAVGPVMKKLYDSLTQIQKGEKDDPYGWVSEVKLR